MYEVELKFPVADQAAIEERLVALAARFREPSEQIDRYFAHPCRDFARTDEALRLRRVADAVWVTWKGPRTDAAAKTRQELELPVMPAPAGGGAVTVEQWTALLEALGFRRVREVAKRRRSARVPWRGTDVEASLDQVTGLGTFLELELIAGQGEVPLAQDCLESLAAALGCTAPERRSYLELLIAATPMVR